MRLCISIASILLVTTPAVAAVITVREETPDRPSVVVVEGIAPHAQSILADIPNYTNTQPTIQISEVRL